MLLSRSVAVYDVLPERYKDFWGREKGRSRMPFIDRRTFLQGTGMLTVGALTSSLQANASELTGAIQGSIRNVTHFLLRSLSRSSGLHLAWCSPSSSLTIGFVPGRSCPNGSSLPGTSLRQLTLQASRLQSIARARTRMTIMVLSSPEAVPARGSSSKASGKFLRRSGKRLTIYHSDPVLGLDVESTYETFCRYSSCPSERASDQYWSAERWH